MDTNLLKNLGLDSSLSQNDIHLLNQILSSIGPEGNKKAPKITAKDRNNLIAKLSSNNTLNEIPKKEFKDMSEQEKKIYREELKKKLKNKQNELKIERTNNLTKQKIANESNFNEAIGKLSEIMKNVDHSASASEILNKTDNVPEQKTNVYDQETIINNIINQSNKEENLTVCEPDNLDDYINKIIY